MDSLKYLKKVSERGSKPGLERITELCRRLGDPQNITPVIHVAGTNGKGSFAAMLSAVLTASGYTVGSFSSPALTGFADSFRINGETLCDSDFDKLITDIIPECETMDDKPTEFETLTAAAYELFRRKNCDLALVECGMGGEKDSTNVVNSPLLSVITNVAIDHMSFLGSTIGEIAAQKAGIIKKNRPVLYGGNSGSALRIISQYAEKMNAPLTVTDHSKISNVRSDIFGTTLCFGDIGEVRTSLTGTYQQYNIANVLTAAEILRSEGLNIPENSIRSGLSAVRWHGRFELLSQDPIIIFDGAHNPDGIIQAAKSIKTYFNGKVVLLVGVMADKEYQLYPELLGNLTEIAFTVTPDNPRALDSKTLAAAFGKFGIEAIPCGSVAEGANRAAKYARSHNIPLVALGSLYMYREFIETL